MSPRIAQYWDTEPVPDYIDDLFDTFRDHNPDFEHSVFSETGAEAFISTHFGLRELTAFRACAIPSMQSDYFRYCFVLAHGGIYADADYQCVRPLRPLVDSLEGGEIFLGPTVHSLSERRVRYVWSGFFGFNAPGHPFLRLALDIATANIEARIPERIWPAGERVIAGVWLTVGPGVLSLMRFLYEWGSFDAFVKGTVNSLAEPFADLYCEVVGDYERIVEAFDGVRVSPHGAMTKWVADPNDPLPYKQTSAHWHNARRAIFR